jgi:hypothetical protein
MNCPSNTHSLAGSASVLQCRCDAGYACSYTKRISATVILNSTLTDFQADNNKVQTNFINALASAAGVPPTNVFINQVSGSSGGNRRMLLYLSRTQNGETGDAKSPKSTVANTVNVHAYVRGTSQLTHFDLRLNSLDPTLHISHRWTEAHRVTSRKIHAHPSMS